MVLKLHDRRVLISFAVVLSEYGESFFAAVLGDEPTWGFGKNMMRTMRWMADQRVRGWGFSKPKRM